MFSPNARGKNWRERTLHPGAFATLLSAAWVQARRLPRSRADHRQAISLPLFPAMTKTQQDRVVSVLHQALVAA